MSFSAPFAPFLRVSAVNMLLALAVLFAGCGKQEPAAAPKQAPETKKAIVYFHPDPATAGSLTGKVTFQGKAPARTAIVMSADAACQKAHAGKPAYDEPVAVDKSGHLANVFVYIKTGLEDKTFEPPKEPAVLDQKGCMFMPRAIGAVTGQYIELHNSDSLSHNVHPLPKNNREWNQEQGPNSSAAEHRFARPEVMIPVKCNIHAWMHAYIGVLPHPYFAVTGPDGSFQMKNLPPGDYTVAAWHEQLGELEQPLHIAPSATGEVNFTYHHE